MSSTLLGQKDVRGGGAVVTGLGTVALAGNPNSGKTTLFNALTGLRQKTANYPGVTVEKKTGRCRLGGAGGGRGGGAGGEVTVIDLPGTYSLVSRSPDEAVACEVLRGLRKDTPPPDAVIVVVDASNLQRNLYLVSQLMELGRPMVVALTMMDVARRRGLRVSAQRLEELLGVPVVGVVGHKAEGVEELKRRLPEARVAALPEFDVPAALREELLLVGGALAMDDTGPGAERGGLDRCKAIAERLLIGDESADLGWALEREGVQRLLKGARVRLERAGVDPIQADVEAHYRWIDQVASAAMEPACAAILPGAACEVGLGGGEAAGAGTAAGGVSAGRTTAAGAGAGGTGVGAPAAASAAAVTWSERIDRVLIHKVWGLVVFAGVMGLMFVSIFSLAKPVMDATQELVTWLGGRVTAVLPAGPIHDLWNDGIVAGVGAVVVFVPQIAILFAFLAVLEDSGYLARAAFLMDRLLSKVGLSGKSFIPLLSSFACAIPGIMATRTIESRRQRLATILVAPFMSCSARLPVYTLLIGTFFAQWGSLVQAGVMLSLYLIGLLAAVGTAWGLVRFGPRDRGFGGAGGFILELPTYKRPQASEVGRQVWRNTTSFVTKAGTTIFCLSVVLWALTYYPRLDEAGAEAAVARAQVSPQVGQAAPADAEAAAAMRERVVAGEQLRHSLAGRFGHLVEPVIRPLGYDWKMGVGLVSAFAAREVFVSTLGIVYSAGDTEESTDSLAEAMRADRYADGGKVWTIPVAASLLVWFVLAMQCMSTLAIVRRETGGWKWPVGMLVYMNAVAYVGALVTYQVLSRVMTGGGL